MFIQEHNCETNEIVVRELNAKEQAQKIADEKEAQTKQAEAEAKATARAAILDRLGLTNEEAAILLS